MSESDDAEPCDMKIISIILGKGWAYACVYFTTCRAFIWLFEEAVADHPNMRAILTSGWTVLPSMLIVHISAIIITVFAFKAVSK